MAKLKKPKAKGKRLENLVSEIIKNEWNLTEDEVHRALTSGNFKHETGDIYFRNKKFSKLWIECKNREDWNFEDVFYFKKSIKTLFLNLLKTIEKKVSKLKEKDLFSNNDDNVLKFIPLLAISKNRYDVYVITIFDSVLFPFIVENFNKYINELSFFVIVNLRSEIEYLGKKIRKLILLNARELFRYVIRKEDF